MYLEGRDVIGEFLGAETQLPPGDIDLDKFQSMPDLARADFSRFASAADTMRSNILVDLMYGYWAGRHNEIYPGKPAELEKTIKTREPEVWSKIEGLAARRFIEYIQSIPGWKQYLGPENLETMKQYKPRTYRYFSPELAPLSKRLSMWQAKSRPSI